MVVLVYGRLEWVGVMVVVGRVAGRRGGSGRRWVGVGGVCVGGWRRDEEGGRRRKGSVMQDLFFAGRKSKELVALLSVLMWFVTFTELEKCFEF